MVYQSNLLSKTLVIGIIFLLIVIIIPSVAVETEKKSSIPTSNGNTLYVGGSGEDNYTKIQDAIDDAVDGDTVFVFNDSSPYNEAPNIISKSISLIGENKETTVTMGAISIKNSNNVIVKGFTPWGFDISNSKYSVISENIMYFSGDFGIRMANSSFHTIINNVIDNKKNGIYTCWTEHAMGPNNYNIIINNTFSNIDRQGIRLDHANHNIVSANTVSSEEYGIYTHNSNNNLIYHNNFINCNENAHDEYSNTWDNGYPSGGNYWDDYTGEDNDGDGIGDTPYNLTGENKDYYPLMEQWVNDNSPPYVEITYPYEGDFVWDKIIVAGTAHDDEGCETLESVEFKVDVGDWETTNGLTSWNYSWDTKKVSNGKHTIFARSYDGELYSLLYILDVIVDNSPLQADANGPYYGLINEPVYFYGSASGGYRPYTWLWDFGDGNTSVEQNPTKTYTNPGNFTINLTVNDEHGNTSDDLSWTWIQASNNPPERPDIDGPASIEYGKIYEWIFTTIDPEGTIIWYFIDWDDYYYKSWYGPYDSGESLKLKHQYWGGVYTPEKYTIKAKAIDVYGAHSNWSEFKVEIPRNRISIDSLFQLFLDRFPLLEVFLRAMNQLR